MRPSIPLLGVAPLLIFTISDPATAQEPTISADSAKAEFLHAWNGYRRHARGHDALKPLSKQSHNWYGTSLLMTAVDAFDTMILMGLTAEAAEAKRLILRIPDQGVVALRGRGLQESYFAMWTRFGIEPEEINYATMTMLAPQYHLRPEIIESAYYLHTITGDEHCRTMGETFFRDLVRYCKTEAGYAALADVTTKQKTDAMESFFLAETMKYLYLLLAPPETLWLNDVVFTTEAHPLRRIPEK